MDAVVAAMTAAAEARKAAAAWHGNTEDPANQEG
jgi:hypothetical protein